MINKIIFTLSFFLLVSAAKAQNEIGVSLRDYSGGVNNNAATIALKANESPDAKNIVIDEPWGQAKTRNGSLTCGSIPSGNTITNTYEYIRANGTHELILTDNTNVYTTIDCVNVSTIVTGLSSVANPYFDTFFDKLWITNKSTHVYTWDGTTLTMLDGTGTKPNPPLGQYITHWKERVWLARTPTEPSAVYFTDLTDEISGSNVDPSISTSAWNTLNAIYIAQEDGSPIYGIKVYRDSLFVFKETGIWRIVFESAFDINVVKSVSNVGCRFQDSIVELDNFLYFVGPDGIYKFDGNDAVRISDNIQQYFNSLKQPIGREGFELWDTDIDFLAGTLVDVTTSYATGNLSLKLNTSSVSYDTFTDGDYTASPTWEKGSGTGDYFAVSAGELQYQFADTDGAEDYYLYTTTRTRSWGDWQIDMQSFNSYGSVPRLFSRVDYYFISSNFNAKNTNAYAVSLDCFSSSEYCDIKLNKWAGTTETNLAYKRKNRASTGNYTNMVCTGLKINVTEGGVFTISTGTYTGNAECDLQYTDNNYVNTGSSYNIVYAIVNSAADYQYSDYVSGGYKVKVDNIYVPGSFYANGTYTSAVSTYSALAVWRTFDTQDTLNGETINYYVRTATSAYNVLTSTWTSINSGNVISTTTNKYFQWKADLATSDTSKTPLIDAVTANYREGDATATRLQMINYKNRLYLTGSTTPANNFNDFVLVKTKSPLDNWIPYDWNISAFTKWNNYLYGGISETANVARFDYGTNDDGRAINAYWTWGDQHWDRMSYKKNLKEIYAFYLPTQSSANTYIGYSIDGGTTWTDRTINMTGTSAFGTKKINNVGGIGNAIRVRVGNNSLDQSFNILGLDLWALPYVNRE